MINEFIEGMPKPQPRVKAFNRGGKAGVYTPDTPALRQWRYNLIAGLQRHKDKNIGGAFEVKLTFYMPRPKSHFRSGKYKHLLNNSAPKYHTSKPDIDNLVKLVLDELGKMRYWKDDAAVVSLKATKEYADIIGTGCRIETKVL